MRKEYLLPGLAVVGGAAGLALRRWQLTTALEPDTGLPIAGRPATYAFWGLTILMAALLRARGVTIFEETIFESRYRHVEELVRMGADIHVAGRVAVVSGTERLYGARVRSTDLRGGAALCVAALAAEGESEIEEIFHIDRGYEDLSRDLRLLGAGIRRADD